MASTESRRIELGSALRALAGTAAPGKTDPRAAMEEALRRRQRAVAARVWTAAAATIALGLPLAFRAVGASAPPAPAIASAAALEFAAGLLAPRDSLRGGLETDLESYIVALWDSD